MSTADSAAAPGTGSARPLDVTIVFHSDWGVSTGTGVAGGVDAVVEKDERGLPVVRGTAITGAVREQAFVVAQALDGGANGTAAAADGRRWCDFVEGLFGSVKRSRLVSFSDARLVPAPQGAVDGADPRSGAPGPDEAVHEVVSLSIDATTGTAKKDHLRLIERARPCVLRGTAELLDTSLDGRPIRWSDEQRDAAGLVLALSALLVRALGSNRSDGDGVCDILVDRPGGGGDAQQVRNWCLDGLRRWQGPAPEAPTTDEDPGNAGRTDAAPRAPRLFEEHGPAGGPPRADKGTESYEADLDIVLRAPVISYDVPFSNELRSLDFLRGTALLPLVHHRLRAVLPADDLVRDAVVRGDLLVSDATVVVNGVRGLPVPLVLSAPKTEGDGEADEGVHALNRLFAEEPANEVHKPLRTGYVFPGPQAAGTAGADFDGAFGTPALLGRQSTAHNPFTGAAGTGQLFMARALPAGMRLRATVTMSAPLRERVKGVLERAFPPDFPERLGVRRLSGTYGRATCRLSEFTAPGRAPAPVWDTRDGQRTATLWFTSDVLARSPRLGPGGGLDDLLRAFERAGAPIELVRSQKSTFRAGIRHRRVDSWAAADRQPRATRMAVKAGSVLRIQPKGDADAVLGALVRLSATGIGELAPQGFGRFAINDKLLSGERLALARLRHQDFVGTRDCAAAKPEEGR